MERIFFLLAVLVVVVGGVKPKALTLVSKHFTTTLGK
jgi:hypothetical protein